MQATDMKRVVKSNPYTCFVNQRRKEEEEATGKKLTLRQGIGLFAAEWMKMTVAEKEQFKITAGKFPAKSEPQQQQVPAVQPSTPQRIPPCLLKSVPPNLQDDYEQWLASKNSFQEKLGASLTRKWIPVHKASWQRFLVHQLFDKESGDPKRHRFVVIQFSYYAVTDSFEFIPAEIGIAVFSLSEGLVDNYCTLIDPGTPPLGYTLDFKTKSQALGVPIPPFHPPCQNYKRIWQSMSEFLDQYKTHDTESTYLFTHHRQVEATQKCLEWLAKQAGGSIEWDIFPCSSLLYQMAHYARLECIHRIHQQFFLDQVMETAAMECMKRMEQDPQFACEAGGEDELVEVNGHEGEDAQGSNEVKRKMIHRHPHFSAWTEYEKSIAVNDLDLSVIDMSTPPLVIENGPARARVIPGKNAELDLAVATVDSMASYTWLDEYGNEIPPVEFNPEEEDRDLDMFTMEWQAQEFLDSMDLAFNAEIACPHHMVNTHGVEHCPLNAVNRSIFNILDILIGFFRVVPEEGVHYPSSDLEDERRRRRLLVQSHTLCLYPALDGFKSSKYVCSQLPAPEEQSLEEAESPQTTEVNGIGAMVLSSSQIDSMSSQAAEPGPSDSRPQPICYPPRLQCGLYGSDDENDQPPNATAALLLRVQTMRYANPHGVTNGRHEDRRAGVRGRMTRGGGFNGIRPTLREGFGGLGQGQARH